MQVAGGVLVIFAVVLAETGRDDNGETATDAPDRVGLAAAREQRCGDRRRVGRAMTRSAHAACTRRALAGSTSGRGSPMRLVSFDRTSRATGWAVEHGDGRIWSSASLGDGLPATMAELLAAGERGRSSACGPRRARRPAEGLPGDVEPARLVAPVPRPGQGRRGRPELLRPRRGGRRSHPGRADALRQVPHVGRRARRDRRVGPRPHRGGGPRGRARRRHRAHGAPRQRGSRPRACPRLHLHQRRQRPRPPGRRQAVRARQVARHVLPDGPGRWSRADEVADPGALAVRSYRNGELMQDGNTSDLIFSVAALVAFCSRAFTLEPGDVIATGTPAGVGWYREPKVRHAGRRRHGHRDRGHRPAREPLPRGSTRG